MSPPTDGNQQPNGHTARATVPRQRRVDIWDQVYSALESKIPKGKWCTKEELVKASGGKHGMAFSVDELTEVIRGKKKKTQLGVDSIKVDGEWQYRFTQSGAAATRTAASKLPRSSPSKSSPSRPPAKKMAPARPMEANGPKRTPSKATSSKATSPKRTPSKATLSKATPSKARTKGAPKRNAPLRPRAKSPRSASKSPAVRSSASRKRGPAKMTTSDGLNMETRLRSGSAKKPRVRRALGPTAAAAVKKVSARTEEGAPSGGGGDAVNVGAREGEEGGSGWSCAIM